MNEESYVVKFLGIPFNITNVVSGLIAMVIVFCLVWFLSRNLALRPKGKQNVLEWIIDFTNGIVSTNVPGEQGKRFNLLAFVLFLFIFVANQMGLLVQVIIGGKTLIKSPTSDPMVTMSLALLVLLVSHYFGVMIFGFKGYLVNSYMRPVSFMLPINVLEEFTNFLTLAFRLYGNIFAGEVLLTLIGGVAKSHGLVTTIVALPLEMIWQGFSIFIGSIQAYVFVTLSMVYISKKVEVEE
ncbi:F0F1 ATP synthase subunit A [Loigolactobacillus coryniformis subsp. coryniformis]|uniref:ATP synthase subunit a n=2 Tax=Loigolactobacillus coryniformis TaxID=1610 RepID=J2Z5H6_9LACO|nr:F0F1 ATP synthase subunit A [Loigolactobacillus coryniformis]MDT3390852.1 F0F1 ATP synthase subunit A [Bacillota bacterium]ATO43494.1 F0F1 ATP synthase subunit A [Loigolactobacillus coryniformis subsp. torquens DSM 20004 = KCTC 3535]EJN55738.1 ATP synthase subunit a [Loigolactobacillus coryniformis subsp. coryniformis CECT 5711]MBW4802197.1 F0F1 ATP synthase subunit A [Loigolactobacillus coryniformis subsp. torquens]MBW4804895.1 F0F1 ATP synthase subunit A [Loigolactobacillus coryniformis s